MMKKVLFAGAVLLTGMLSLNAQRVTKYTTTENATWVMAKAALATKADGKVVATATPFWHILFGAFQQEQYSLLKSC